MSAPLRPSTVRVWIAVLAAAATFVAVGAPVAHASKGVVGWLGNATGSGSKGGEINNPRNVGVNTSGAGPANQGDIYVVDENNARIERFDSEGNFISAWGANVETASVNEVQLVKKDATGGTFTLKFHGVETAAIAFNATAATVQTALRNLSTIGSPNVTVTGVAGGPWTVTFVAAFSATQVEQLIPNSAALTGGTATATVETTADGSGAFEICTVAGNCRAGTPTGAPNEGDTAKNGSLDNPQSVAVDNDTGNVYVSDRDNLRINEYDGVGTFIRSFGWNVDETEPAVTYEICPAANRCRNGVAGAGAGQVGASGSAGIQGIAVSQADSEPTVGTVFFADTQNRRVNTYNLDGTSPSSFGSSANFASNFPSSIAVDSAGIVYASDSNEGGRVNRYSTGGATFLAPILATIAGTNERQKVQFTGFETGEPYTLTCPNSETTGEIEYKQTGEEQRGAIRKALEEKCGPSFVLEFGPANPRITFTGNFAETNVPPMACTKLAGPGTCEVITEVEGKAPDIHALLTGATSGLAVSEAGVLYVLRDPVSGPTVVQQFNEPGEPTAPTAANDSHGGAAGFGSVQGLGLDSATGTLYVSATTSIAGLSAGHRVYYLNEVVVPQATVDEVTGITSTEATIDGTINPNESTLPYPHPPRTSYHPEFKLESDTAWTKFGNNKLVASPGNTPTSVSTGLSELTPNEPYEARYVAVKQYGDTFPGAAETFATLGDRPRIEAVWATEVRETSAKVHARINDLGTPSSYCFEYGTTISYGSSQPNCVPGGEVPGGEEVEAALTDLIPGSVYHYRAVATNSFGTTKGADHTFEFSPPGACPNNVVRQQTGAAYLPDCRGYELVNPPQLGGTALLPLGPASPYPSSQGRFAYTGLLNALPESGEPINGSFFGDFYVASRTASGWISKYVGIPGYESIGMEGAPDNEAFQNGTPEPDQLGSESAGSIPTDTEMSRYLIWDAKGSSALLTGSELTGSSAPYLYDNEGNFLARLPTNLEELPGEIETPPRDKTEGGFWGTGRLSGDARHYIFSSREVAFAPGGQEQAPGSVYDNDLSTESVTVISETEAGEPIKADPAGQAATQEIIIPRFVSEDGSRVLMSTRGEKEWWVSGQGPRRQHLYLHDSTESKTYEVSWNSVEEKNVAVTFEGVVEDGRKVFFSTDNKMTTEDLDSSFDLYMWSEATNLVTLISVGGGAGNTDECSAELMPERPWQEISNQIPWIPKCGIEVVPWQEYHCGAQPCRFRWADFGGVGAHSEPVDSSIATGADDIYFYSPEVLEVGRGFPDARNLYVYHNGSIQFVSRLTGPGMATRINVSKDGKHMALITKSRLTTYDNAGKAEMYVYDPDARTMTCASCRPDGSPPSFDVEGSQNGRFMTDDGRAFFATKESLVPRDGNGINDVYEFVNARPQLITSGSGSEEGGSGNEEELLRRGLVGVTANGIDVFFGTFDTLVGQDESGGVYKFYDARTNGGFPFNKPPAPCEAADECHGAESQPAAPLQLGTGQHLGEGGNFRPGRKTRCGKGFRRRNVHGKSRCVKKQQRRRHHRHTRGNG